ncbi:MAG: hypothetical protein CME63_14210 [Halobacteriovoraceae bacterium]|nr:hypothetical protein [Halobacteriovoraceae bacterium]MBC98894.1 hypothetical protein [Halobacteriovoraceae bacterium]|tara:strand:- start:94 stop:495 length:402 start_codon:yes stop_codon:yes gene_type:complete
MSILKSILALGLLILLSQAINASPKDCIDNLMINSNVDSYNFSIHGDDVDRDFGRDYLAEAIYTIRILLDRNGCSQNDVNFGQGPHGRSHSRCSKLVGNQDHSRVCYVETNLGYFFVTRDLLDNFNISYARWD